MLVWRMALQTQAIFVLALAITAVHNLAELNMVLWQMLLDRLALAIMYTSMRQFSVYQGLNVTGSKFRN